MALSLRAWVNKHMSAINEVRPLNHQVFCDSLRDTTAFDSFLGALDAEGDGEQWITTKNGHHVLIDGEGTVKAGMGGNFNGEKISEAHKGSARSSSASSASKVSNSSKAKYSASSNPKEYDDLWQRTYFDGVISNPVELDKALQEKRDLPKEELDDYIYKANNYAINSKIINEKEQYAKNNPNLSRARELYHSETDPERRADLEYQIRSEENESRGLRASANAGRQSQEFKKVENDYLEAKRRLVKALKSTRNGNTPSQGATTNQRSYEKQLSDTVAFFDKQIPMLQEQGRKATDPKVKEYIGSLITRSNLQRLDAAENLRHFKKTGEMRKSREFK